MSLTYRVIATGELSPRLVEAWRAILVRNHLLGSPYFCAEFTLLVAQVRRDVRVVVIEDGSRVVGFFPHQRSALGLGKPVGGPLSDYHGVVAEPECPWEVEQIMRAAKLATWEFDHLAGEVRDFGRFITARHQAARIDLSAGYDYYLKDRRAAGSSYIGKTEGLARKLGREIGKLEFALHDDSETVLEQLILWKREQYNRSKIPDVFGVQWTRNLLGRIAQLQTEGFAGVCSTLRVDGRIVAIHMGMRSREVFHYWFPTYDPKFAKFSVGIILLLRIAEAIAKIGIRTIDLGIADGQYKERLMTDTVQLSGGCVAVPSFLAFARRIRLAAEAQAEIGGIAAMLRLPLRAVRRLERLSRFR